MFLMHYITADALERDKGGGDVLINCRSADTELAPLETPAIGWRHLDMGDTRAL